MNVTDFPAIVDPETSTKALAVATIKSLAISKVMAVEPELRALAERYRAVVFELKTPKGLAEAKAARHDLRENGRYAVQRAEQAVRDEANAVKKDLEPIAAKLIAITKPTEDDLDAAIKAREAEIEREKEAARQAEATRTQKHRDGIERINAYVKQAQGLPSERISKGIAALQAMEFGESWEEFKEQAIAARDSTFVALQSLFATTKAAEDEAIRLEMQRQEQARIAAEQRAEADRLAKAREELERQQREIIEAAKAEAAAAAVRTHGHAGTGCAMRAVNALELEFAAAQLAQQAQLTSAAASPEANGTAVTPGPSQPEAAPINECARSEAEAPPPIGGGLELRGRPTQFPVGQSGGSPAPTLKLGDICARLGFTLSAVFISERLGIDHAATEEAAKLFHERDFSRICERLVTRIREAQAGIY